MEFVFFFFLVRVVEILVIGKLEFSETCEWENWNSLTEMLILGEYEIPAFENRIFCIHFKYKFCDLLFIYERSLWL